MKKIGILAVHKKDKILGNINRITLDYTQCIENIPETMCILIPTNTKNIDAYIDMLDAFIIPGGNDIAPELYGETTTQSRDIIKEHDDFLIHFLQKVIPRQKPVLGICKGLQMINVFFGGTLHQNIKHHMHTHELGDEVHKIHIQDDSFLFDIFHQNTIAVNSIHHQCIHKLGDQLKICAVSEKDNIIEGICHTNLPLYGVQWHPEYLSSHQKIFDWFIQKIK